MTPILKSPLDFFAFCQPQIYSLEFAAIEKKGSDPFLILELCTQLETDDVDYSQFPAIFWVGCIFIFWPFWQARLIFYWKGWSKATSLHFFSISTF